jgi:signal transduction histidine kinase
VSHFDFQELVEHLPLVVYVDELDDRSSPLYISPQIAKLLGYSPAEWVADPDLYVTSIHPEDRERVLREISIRNEQGTAVDHADYRMFTRDGRSVGIRDDEIVVQGTAQGYLQDVTARTHSTIRLELLAYVLSLAAEELSPQELISRTADKLSEAFGIGKVTFVELAAGNLVTPRYTTDPKGLPLVMPMIPEAFEPLAAGPVVIDDVLDEPWLEPVWPVLAANDVRSAVDVPLWRNGEIVAVLWFNSPEPRHWAPEEVRALTEIAAQLAVVLERSEEREQRFAAERDLRSRDAILEAISRAATELLAEPDWHGSAPSLLEALGRSVSASRAYIFENGVGPDGVTVVTSQRFEWAVEGIRSELDNEAMQEMAFAAVGLERFEHVCSRDELFAGIVSGFAPEERPIFEAQGVLSIMTVPIFAGGLWWGFIGFDDCVREREWTAAEVEALRLAGSLLSAAIERRRSESERGRLETELLASQKLESIGRLAGGVAHDFNNLLTAITGYTSLLLERTEGDAELAHDLGEIHRASERAAELTRQLLAFGRRQMLQPRAVDLNQVLAETGSLLRRLLGEHVELELVPAPNLGTVRVDPGQIEQVIVNLAVNARDAMPDGGRLTIATHELEVDGRSVVELEVTDTGIGMDEGTKAQIFEPFFTTRAEGSGLGLASVHGIVHQSEGEVMVESEPGIGSTFRVRLPRVPEPAAGDAPATPIRPVSGSETILLVEDEHVVRALAQRVLERCGYTVLACADGAEALRVAGSPGQHIDLLLTDVVMPGLRGHEVAERVTASRPGVKVLYMSGYADEALLGRAAIHERALIEKPFAVDALAERVREALGA